MFNYSAYNGGQGIICFCIYILMLLMSIRMFTGEVPYSRDYKKVFIFILIYSVFGLLEWDTYHYYAFYEEMYRTHLKIHVEDFYFNLILLLPHSYLLWRLIIWGSMSIIMVFVAKRLHLNSYVFCGLSALMLITRFTVTRGGLAIALMMLLILFYTKSTKNKLFKSLFYVIGMLGTIYFHSSAFIFIILIFISLFIPFNKTVVKLSFFAFPFLYIILTILVNHVIELGIFNEEQANFISMYNNQESGELNILGKIPDIIEKLSFVFLIFLLTKKYIFTHKLPSESIFSFFKISYIFIYVALLFWGQDTSDWISSRLLHAASFSLILCSVPVFDSKENRKSFLGRLCLFFFLLNSLWHQLYFIYKY